MLRDANHPEHYCKLMGSHKQEICGDWHFRNVGSNVSAVSS